MFKNVPNSYKDPYWSGIASKAEKKVGLPDGLLNNILTKGERSNADQTSEAGAKTPFQIIPQTRQAIIKKWGIDPYLSPDNAAEGAALLLKDSLKRNNGDVIAAIGEYHGGINRKNWGQRTKDYISRVSDISQTKPVSSTFQRVMRDNPQYAQKDNAVSDQTISQLKNAYDSGLMTPEDSRQFEDDVKNGLIVFPKSNNKGGGSPPSPTILPESVTKAYKTGQMAPEEAKQLESDIKNGLVKLSPLAVDRVMYGEDYAENIPTPEQPATLGQKALGAGEAVLSTATGLTGGAAGYVGGAAKGLTQQLLNGQFGTQQAAQAVEEAATKGAQALTYAPRTETGQQYAENIGGALQQLPIAPLMPEAMAIGGALQATKPLATNTAALGAQALKGAGKQALNTAKQSLSSIKPAVSNAVGSVKETIKNIKTPSLNPASVGAAVTDVAKMRQTQAQDLPIPVNLTRGQATRDYGQLRFEQETAKNAELGAPIRERMAQQQQSVQQSFDVWIDKTGAQAPDVRSAGITIDKALQNKINIEKKKISEAYAKARDAGEMSAPVNTKQIVQVLNDSISAESTAPILITAKQELQRLGGAAVTLKGNLRARRLSLNNVEQLRKLINKSTGSDASNIKFAGDIKRAIDATTENAGGALYKQARELRAKFARDFEDRSVISDLIKNKTGTADRKVALEDMADRIIYRSSLDDVIHAKKVFQSAGEEGMQAWKEVQGQALTNIKERAIKNVARDQNGNPVISPAALDKAIKQLDADGKLDYLFGKNGGEKLRAVNDLAKVMFTVPAGAVNTSNTASVLLAAMDMAISGSAGMPLPVMSGIKMMVKRMKDRKIKARVKHALKITN